jgi:hypothetical protein
MSSDPDKPATQDGARIVAADNQPEEAGAKPWWRRSPVAAAAAAVAIGAATLWFGNMLNRVPLDDHATLGYLLMLPLLLIVPAFSAAGLRLAWLGLMRRCGPMSLVIAAAALAGAVLNIQAIVRFAQALMRIFGN